MIKQRIICILLIISNIFICLSAGGCSHTNEAITENGTETVLAAGEYQIYYLNKDKNSLQSEVIKYKESKDSLDIAQECMNIMNEKLSKEIAKEPVTLDILGMTLSEGILTLDMNLNYNQIDYLTKILVRACIVLTLTQIEGVEYINITINGQSETDEMGNTVGVLKADDFVNLKDNFPYTKKEVTLLLYFASTNEQLLKAKQLKTYYDYSVSYEEILINNLIQGVTEDDIEKGYKSTLPKGTSVNMVYTKDGVCYVDFDESILDTVRPVTTELLLYSIINTLTESSYITKVQFSVDGETDIMLYNEYDLSEPFSRNADLIIKEVEDNK